MEDDLHEAQIQAQSDGEEVLAANGGGYSIAGAKIDAVVLRIARLIGRQMAREECERLNAANDNDPRVRYDE